MNRSDEGALTEKGFAMGNERRGKIALIRYDGGVLGERKVDHRTGEPLAVRIGASRLPKGIDNAASQYGNRREGNPYHPS